MRPAGKKNTAYKRRKVKLEFENLTDEFLRSGNPGYGHAIQKIKMRLFLAVRTGMGSHEKKENLSPPPEAR